MGNNLLVRLAAFLFNGVYSGFLELLASRKQSVAAGVQNKGHDRISLMQFSGGGLHQH
jgi:hypothetical protein